MAAQSYGHSADYTYIDHALRAQWNPFVVLEAEMMAFVPRPVEDFSLEREAKTERFGAINPHMSEEELAAFVDRQMVSLVSPDWQFNNLFNQRHMTHYVTVVILSHSLCEALINAILAIGLVRADSADLFSLLEKADFKQKWVVGPKSFAPIYHFPKDTALYESLVLLSRQRNAIVHHKIDLEVEGAQVLKGSAFERAEFKEELRWLRRFFSLPYDLVEFVERSIRGVATSLIFGREPIERAPEHRSAANANTTQGKL